MTKKIILFFLIVSSSIFLYFAFNGTKEKKELVEIQKGKNDVEEEQQKDTSLPSKGKYFEDVVIIDRQEMYYAYPEQTEKIPELVIYSHGQFQKIVQDLNDPYMLKIQEYGEFFASKGFAFSASNQHGDNWGQKESLKDINNSIEWFEINDLPIQDKVYMIGFSMGGLAPINYAIENPEDIKSVALLAPTPRSNLNKSSVEVLKGIPIKIWHGTGDVNIPFTASQQYVGVFENFGKEVELIPIENAQHYDVETNLMEEILEFFKY